MDKAWCVCLDNLHRWPTNPRIYVLAILTALLQERLAISQIRAFSFAVGIKVAPWIYPHIMDSWYLSMLILFGVVLLFCDAPFMNEGTAYLFIRSGRRAWFLGQVMYVVIASIIYQLFIVASGILLLIPRLTFDTDWGKVIGTFSNMTGVTDFGANVLNNRILLLFSPIRAMLICFSLCTMVTVIFGMLVFTTNLYLPRSFGPIFGLVLALLLPFSVNFSGKIFYYLSPGTWMLLSSVDITNTSSLPSLSYILITGLCTILTLIFLAGISYRRHPIETLSAI